MIERVRIKNLVLMDLCEIEFQQGLIIITGETGAGKTALTSAFSLILGERSDSSLVRQGEEKAHIEASFSVSENLRVLHFLEEHGIDHKKSDPLIISKEITKDGKSRSFINRQAVPLTVLAKLGEMLIQLIGQHSYNQLKSPEKLRESVDSFGSIEKDVEDHTLAYENYQSICRKIDSVNQKLLEKERSYDRLSEELLEIKKAQLKEDEDELLFQEYSFHSGHQEIMNKCKEISDVISSSQRPILRQLSTIKHSLEALSLKHKRLSEYAELVSDAILSLQEVDHGMQKALDDVDISESKLERIEARLAVYQKIKKKYGPTFNDWMSYKESLEIKLKEFDGLQQEIEDLLNEQNLAKDTLAHMTEHLTKKRKESAKKLELDLSKALNELNMPGAIVQIEIKKHTLSSHGQDQVMFWLQANKGEKPSCVKDSASGGELSRLLLALKTCLAEKNDTPTIIFDEIDANVGGTTAKLIADKLKLLSKNRQIFCITHFPQVAKFADIHLKVCKSEHNGRTVARVEKLTNIEKKAELLRMLGGEKV